MALDIKMQVNNTVTVILFTSTVCIFILLLGSDMKGFLVSLQTRIVDGLNLTQYKLFIGDDKKYAFWSDL